MEINTIIVEYVDLLTHIQILIGHFVVIIFIQFGPKVRTKINKETAKVVGCNQRPNLQFLIIAKLCISNNFARPINCSTGTKQNVLKYYAIHVPKIKHHP